jgi:hypothetical protein
LSAFLDENGGPSVSVDTNVTAFLNYDVYQDGYANMVFDSGSISLWCQANWTSTTDGGSGPTNWAVLFSVGNWTSNAAQSAWMLAISPDGTNLVMEAQAAGSNQIVFNVPIDFDAGDWHSVTVTYSPSNCCLYLEGQFVTNTEPISNIPSSSDCTNYGMFVGSLSTTGICQFHGQFQWFDTYDYPLTTNAVASDYAEVSSYIVYYGGSLPAIGATGGFHPADDGPPAPGGGGTNSGGYTDYITNTFTPPTGISATNYAAYNAFYLTITNSSSAVYVTACNTLSNLTYEIETNADLSDNTGWGVWQTFIATNSITPVPSISAGSNALFFRGLMIVSTGTNGLPDFWCMEYFATLNVDPYADPDGDNLCNFDEYLLGTNPTNAYSVSSLHKDGQAELLAFTNDPACVYHLAITNGADTNTVLLTMSTTQIGTNYQIYSKDLSVTNGAWRLEQSFVGTNSATTVAVVLNGRTLAFVGAYGEDSDGDGLPDGYEVLSTLTDPYLPDTGFTGVIDSMKDPDGDGYVNIVEYQNGTDPHVFKLGQQNLWVNSSGSGSLPNV